MGPKKGPVIDENLWRTTIEKSQLDDETFKVKVIIIEAAGSDQDRIYLNKFETFAAEERRFVIKNICKTETIFMVNQLGGEKKVKDDNLRVFEEGQSFLKDKKDIPSDVLALIIKHLILKMKDEYLFIKRQRLEVKEGMRRESATMINKAEVRGTVNVKAPAEPQPIPAPPPVKGKGKKSEPETAVNLIPEPDEGKKYNTLLRVRGEEWRDKVYVDDFPIDGPNLYIAITGFVDPFLALHLIKIGVQVTGIAQIRIDPISAKVPSTLFRATKRGQSLTEILTEKSLKFWEDIQELRIDKNTADDFKDTVFIVFSPPYWDTEKLSGSPDKIYDELCYLMYDIQDLTRQHTHFLDNMEIINIPKEDFDDSYIKHYLQSINDIPLECITAYSVLDSILQTVCLSEELENKSNNTSLSSSLALNQPCQSFKDKDRLEKAETFVKEVFNSLCKSDLHKKSYRITYGEESENHKDPIVINYGDYAKYATFHLGNINLDNIVSSMLSGMPIHKLWKSQDSLIGELEAKINFHINVLLSCFNREDVEMAELNRLLHVLSCRKLYNNRSSLKKHHLSPSTITEFKKTFLKRSVLAEPIRRCPSPLRSQSSTSPSFPSISKSENMSDLSSIEDPEIRRIKFLFDCPDISELVSASEIANNTPINHMIDDFEFFEDFTGISAFQILHGAFNEFNCVDYKYCEVTDCYILMFFNSHDKDGIAREQWRCHVPTPLCLQDFFDFVLEEHYDWIQNEEKIYDEIIISKSQLENKDVVDPFAPKSCVENTEVEMDLLMEGSLKYQEIANLEEVIVEQDDNIVTSSKNTTSASTAADSKRGKKNKSSLTSTPRNAQITETSPKSVISIDIPKKRFLGYDLGDRRFEVFGKDSSFFSNDGTRVFSKYILLIPMNLEYIYLNIVPGNTENEFSVHKALGDFSESSEVVNVCESFRINTKNHVMINIKKQSYQTTIPIPMNSSTEYSRKKESVSKENNNITENLMETRFFHSFFITWPNGLITESVYEDNSPVISHVKQYYVVPLSHLDEEMRCISLNGEVIVFKKSGLIEVLRSDGTYIKITKCKKRMIVPEIPEDFISETSSDKNKKSKGKEKSNKSSKSSKNTLQDDDKISNIPEYELVIDEFEIIEPSGLRQKWIGNDSYFIEKLLIRTATDYCLGEVFSRRMDGTNILLNKDGIQVVLFPNNTRIITSFIVEDDEIFPEWTEEEKEYYEMFESDIVETNILKSKGSVSQKSYTDTYTSAASSMSKKLEEEEIKDQERTDGYVSVQIIYTIEHVNFTTVTVNKANAKITIESPNDASMTVDSSNNYEMKLDSFTSANFDGENLHIHYEACHECHSNTNCDIKIMSDEMSSVTQMHQKYWLKMKDSFFKKIIVNDEGGIILKNDTQSDESLQIFETSPVDDIIQNTEEKQNKSESAITLTSHGKCTTLTRAKAVRFFVLNRELSCSELVHRSLVDEYKQTCRWQPWCSISQHDTFGDHRNLLSVLTPIHLTESEKWLMESKLADKPKYLSYKDLKQDSGKGFYHWMRPYERFEPRPIKPANVLPPALPKAYVLRTLEQQWKENEREELKGAKELLRAILKYRHIMESDSETLLTVPLRDSRSEDEIRTDDMIQALAHRIYEDLKDKLQKDVESRTKATITTKPPKPPEEIEFVEDELGEEILEEQETAEDERARMLRELEEIAPMSEELKRYWRRRAEEYKEEQFYRYLLREGSVPPYFRNVLGGAIWWEMNNVTDEAVTKSQRRKMKCVCDEQRPHTEDEAAGFSFM